MGCLFQRNGRKKVGFNYDYTNLDKTIPKTKGNQNINKLLSTIKSNENSIEGLMDSSDNFTSCVQMTGQPTPTNSENRTFNLTPSTNLSYTSNYKIRILTTLVDNAGNQIGTLWEYFIRK